MNRDQLQALIRTSLREQGFRVRNKRIIPPDLSQKDKIRELHSTAVAHRQERSKDGLFRHEARLLKRIASGTEVVPCKIKPRLVEVKAHSEDELLFRYIGLHWAIPVSSGYGRRLRFLVIDEQNDKVIGLIGLGDPVFNLAVRDEWVGWNMEARRGRLCNVMDAFILGAVPPYSQLLCGKLVALLAASNEVRHAFMRKYHAKQSVIRRKPLDARLALITTLSALGRSSVYNRLRFSDELVFRSLGFSEGSGEFHFSNGLYHDIYSYANRYCDKTAKNRRWGTGFRNKREVIRKCLAKVDLPADFLYHGIRREVFAVPLARNTREFLRGEHSKLMWFDYSAEHLFEWFRERWLLPRAAKDPAYLQFCPDSYNLWASEVA
jgi:hypothetical protein